jgi:hypothetical protein
MEQMEVPVPETAHVRIPCVLGSPDCEVVAHEVMYRLKEANRTKWHQGAKTDFQRQTKIGDPRGGWVGQRPKKDQDHFLCDILS